MRRLSAEERKVLLGIFALYRAYKVAIVNRTIPAKRGFAGMIHPDLIQASRVHGSLPQAVIGFAMTPSFSDKAYRRFIWRIDWHVKQLCPYHRAIIRTGYLCAEPLPKSRDIYANLYQRGYAYSERFFETAKKESFEELYLSLQASNGAESEDKTVRRFVRKIRGDLSLEE